MRNNMSQNDMRELAVLSCNVIHRIDFPEIGELDFYRGKLTKLLDELQSKYKDNELLFDTQCAILGQPFSKPALYKLIRSIVRMARNQASAFQNGFEMSGAMVQSIIPDDQLELLEARYSDQLVNPALDFRQISR